MSLTLGQSNFTQFEKDFFITEATFGLDSINKGLFYISQGVKNDQYTYPVLQANTKLQPFGSIPTDQQSTVLSNRTATLGKFTGYETFEPAVFENHWQVSELSNSLLSRGLPSTFESYLSTYYTSKTFEPVELMIHQGSTTYLTTGTGSAAPGGVNESLVYFDGIIKQALNVSTPALKVTNTGLTAGNIIGYMETSKKQMPKALLSKANRYERLKYIMSVEDFQKYEDALTTTTFKNNDTTERGISRYKGYEVVTVAGLPENTFYFCECGTDMYSNLHLPITDMSNISFEINRLQNNSTLYFYKSIIKMAALIGKPTEFVICTGLTLDDFSK
jgi:hypothetical protein